MALRAKAKPQLLNVNRVPGQPKRKKKITLVFDENKRREFLGGFHKRKVQRQKRAQEELQKQLKEERRKIKQDAKARYKKLLSNRDVPELQKLLSAQEYDIEGHTVSILELDVGVLSEGHTLIGENKCIDESKDEEVEENNENGSDEDEEIVGMSLTEKQKTNTPQRAVVNKEPMKSKKDLKRVLKKAALKQVKKSKVFQRKQRLDNQKNKKQTRKKLMKKQISQKNENRSKRKSTH